MKNLKFLVTIFFLLLALILWIAVTLTGEYVVNISIPLQLSSTSKDLAVDVAIPSEVKLKIKSSGWNILRTKMDKNKRMIIDLNQFQNNSTIQFSKFNPEQFDLISNIEIIDVKPETITLSLRRAIEKRVVIAPLLNISFKKDYARVSKITVIPNELTIRGTNNILSKIDTIFTQEIFLSDLAEDVDVTVQLKDTLLNSVVYERVPVQVKFKVEQIADKEFNSVFVQLENIPPNKDIVAIPPILTVKVRGGIKILSTLTDDSIKTFIDYSKVNLDSSSLVKPSFILPEGTELVESIPEQVNLIIRK